MDGLEGQVAGQEGAPEGGTDPYEGKAPEEIIADLKNKNQQLEKNFKEAHGTLTREQETRASLERRIEGSKPPEPDPQELLAEIRRQKKVAREAGDNDRIDQLDEMSRQIDRHMLMQELAPALTTAKSVQQKEAEEAGWNAAAEKMGAGAEKYIPQAKAMLTQFATPYEALLHFAKMGETRKSPIPVVEGGEGRQRGAGTKKGGFMARVAANLASDGGY